jgi:hypothetical protein
MQGRDTKAASALGLLGSSVGGTVQWIDALDLEASGPKMRSAYSYVVAEVAVEQIVPTQFNTTTGAPPTSQMGPDPMVDDSEWNLWGLVVLDVQTLYAGGSGGPNVEKIVTGIMGGTYVHAATGTTYEHIVVDPDYKYLKQVGQSAMLFGQQPLGETPPAPGTAEPWQDRAWAKVDELEQLGYTTIYASAEGVYVYDAGMATSVQDGLSVSIATIRDIAANPPPW